MIAKYFARIVFLDRGLGTIPECLVLFLKDCKECDSTKQELTDAGPVVLTPEKRQAGGDVKVPCKKVVEICDSGYCVLLVRLAGCAMPPYPHDHPRANKVPLFFNF